MRFQETGCILCVAVLLFLLPIAIVLLPYSPAYLIAAHAAQKEIPSIPNEERLVAIEQIVSYLWTGSQYTLSLSEQANTHMADVRRIFLVGESLVAISLIAAFILRRRITSTHFWSAACAVSIAIVALTILCSISFERSFALFHTILFRNDLWLFPSTDSLVLCFPPSFFISISISIAAVILVVNLLLVVFLAKGDARQRVDSGDPAQHI
jgi:integral membrane protein (TIGR01906 family)